MPTPSEFVAKWQGSTRTERAAAQEHFIDLHRILGQPTPNNADPTGDWYSFEKGAPKTTGGDGWADVWKLKDFAWEHKGKHKDLVAAYKQLLDYHDALENQPLLKQAHSWLDAAVQAAYGRPEGLSDDQILARLLELNLVRSGGPASTAGGAS